jgi:hypothetical protein
VASAVNEATEKTTPVDADQLSITDSAAGGALRRVTFASLATWVRGVVNAMATITSAKTLTGQLQLTGQSAVDDNSAMTRRLALLHSVNCIDLYSGLVGSVTGTGATQRRNAGATRIVDGDLTTAAAANAAHMILISSGAFDGVFDTLRAISFTRRWVMFMRVGLAASTNTQQFFALGAGTTIATHSLGLPTSGNSVGWVLDSPTSLRLWRCVGGIITYSSAINPGSVTATTQQSITHHIWIECDGANSMSLRIATHTHGTAPPSMPAIAQLTLGSLPVLSDKGAVQVLRCTAASPASFTGQALLEAKLINF